MISGRGNDRAETGCDNAEAFQYTTRGSCRRKPCLGLVKVGSRASLAGRRKERVPWLKRGVVKRRGSVTASRPRAATLEASSCESGSSLSPAELMRKVAVCLGLEEGKVMGRREKGSITREGLLSDWLQSTKT